MQKKQIVDYDDTKKMLNTLRRLNESRTSFGSLIREQNETEQPDMDDVFVVNDVDVKMISNDQMDLKLMDDQKTSISNLIDSFREQVSQIADLKPGITMKSNQIRLDGNIPDLDINFIIIAGEESGLYLNADMLKIEEETNIQIQKLLKFEETFKTTMEPMIRDRNTN
jgi:SMC interacting uncharacterized protein involved in chromosome segregation